MRKGYYTTKAFFCKDKKVDKFLIDKKGEVVARYEPTADLLEIPDAVDRLVRQ